MAPPSSRAGFAQVGEELWRIGEQLQPEQRGDEMSWAPSPLSITIEEGDREQWWLLLNCAFESHPPWWQFVRGFEDAFWALVKEPQQRVHQDYPDDFY